MDESVYSTRFDVSQCVRLIFGSCLDQSSVGLNFLGLKASISAVIRASIGGGGDHKGRNKERQGRKVP